MSAPVKAVLVSAGLILCGSAAAVAAPPSRASFTLPECVRAAALGIYAELGRFDFSLVADGVERACAAHIASHAALHSPLAARNLIDAEILRMRYDVQANHH